MDGLECLALGVFGVSPGLNILASILALESRRAMGREEAVLDAGNMAARSLNCLHRLNI